MHPSRIAAHLVILTSVLLIGCPDPKSPEVTGLPVPMLEGANGENLAPLGEVGSYDAEVPNAWCVLAYNVTKTEFLSPLLASRNFGYIGVALYEALVGGMPGYQSLAGQLNELTSVPSIYSSLEYHWPTVANTTLAGMMSGLFDGRLDARVAIRALHDDFASRFRPTITREVYTRSVMHGREVAKAILAWADKDGFSTYEDCDFSPPVGRGLWTPTPPSFLPPHQPCWGKVRTSVVPDGSFGDPGPHPAYSELPGDPFYIEAEEVYKTASNLTQEQLDIALYWADHPGSTGTPAGHSLSICRQIIEQEGIMLDGAAEAYARVGLALQDAFIVCWWWKYKYNFVRPVTYIRAMWDSTWLPPVSTTPFPDYTSGHSVQSGASAQVMHDLWGDIPFTDHTLDSFGFAPRSYDSIFKAAKEASLSRLYAGIHYRSALERGLAQGRVIGKAVSALRFSTASAQVSASTR